MLLQNSQVGGRGHLGLVPLFDITWFLYITVVIGQALPWHLELTMSTSVVVFMTTAKSLILTATGATLGATALGFALAMLDIGGKVALTTAVYPLQMAGV